MFDAKGLLDRLLGGSEAASSPLGDRVREAGELARNHPLAAGALAAILLGTDPGRKLAGAALRMGGLAAVGALGYRAYRNWQSGHSPEADPREGSVVAETIDVHPAPAGTGFAIDDEENHPDFATVLVRAMIAAARADGHLDEEERQAILARVKLANLDPDAEGFLSRELATPASIDTLIAAAETQSQKVELYTASRIAIDPDTKAERGYLDLLAGRLGLPDELVGHIESVIASARGA